MKTYRSFSMQTKSLKFIFLTLACLAGLITACDSDAIDEKYLYTSNEQTMSQYLSSNPDDYSEFVRLLDTTSVLSLLGTSGSFTCFAPDNAAMKHFYELRGKTDLSGFSEDSLLIIAYDHIINGSTILNVDFTEGNLSQLTMSNRFISISYSGTSDVIVNKESLILEKDIEVHNGVIHKISEVINPTRSGVVEAIQEDGSYSLFYEAMVQTGLADSLYKVTDLTYDATLYLDLISTTEDAGEWYYDEIPRYRQYGYTVFVESDSTYAANDITSLEQLVEYAASKYDEVYPDDAGITDLKDRKNSLNRFVAYHIIEKTLTRKLLIDAYDTPHMLETRDMYEYIETYCPNTLIEVTKERTTGKTNQINKLPEVGTVIQLDDTNFDITATNGIFHEVDNILVYDKDVDNMLSTKRLRFDSGSFFPELTNNNLRGSYDDDSYQVCNCHYKLPRGYVDRITCSEQTVVGYLHPYYKYQNYEGDEIFLSAESGKLYDFTIITPSVPAGNYEVRFGYLSNGKRGVAQLYMDGTPTGVPLNLNTTSDDPSIGYVEPKTDEDDYYGYQNDKMMRNRGYMKGPACYKVPTDGWSYGENARYSTQVLRKILGTYTFKTAANHEFMVKGLSGGEFMFDYLEFVPTSLIESEDIY